MKTLLYIFLFFVPFPSFSQTLTSNDAEVEYKIFNNTDKPNTLFSTLFINGTTTIYLPKYNTKVVNNPEKNVRNVTEAFVDHSYIKIDHVQKEILSFEDIGRTVVLVKDDYNELKWEITEEAKEIAGYSCIKANTSFRGRDWVAWFTPQIPLPYGPWKLHGLPGLILEAYETTNTFTWRIEKIEYKKSDIFNKDFKTLVITKNETPISMKQYLEDDKEYYENMYARRKQENPNDVFVPGVARRGYELQYEWE